MIANDVSNRVDVVKWNNDVSEVVPLDLDALRLVVDAARETAYQAKYGKGTLEYHAVLQPAIAKIETILK